MKYIYFQWIRLLKNKIAAELRFKMRRQNVWGRRYFYPLISDFSTYSGLESAQLENIPIAYRIANSVICLPIYHGLTDENIQRILDCIIK